MQRTVLIVIVLLVCASVAVAQGGVPAGLEKREVIIPDGTVVRVRLLQSLSSKTTQEGEPFYLEVVEDVVVGDFCVIEEGARARGTVLKAKKSRSFGRKGKLDLTFDYVEAVNRQKIGLRAEKQVRGKGNYAAAGVVTYLTGPFGAFVKGKNVTLKAGTEYSLFIDGDRRLHVGGSR